MGEFVKAKFNHRALLVHLQHGICAYCWGYMQPPRVRDRKTGLLVNAPFGATLEHVHGRNGNRYVGLKDTVAVCAPCNGSKSDRKPTGCELIALMWVTARLELHEETTDEPPRTYDHPSRSSAEAHGAHRGYTVQQVSSRAGKARPTGQGAGNAAPAAHHNRPEHPAAQAAPVERTEIHLA